MVFTMKLGPEELGVEKKRCLNVGEPQRSFQNIPGIKRYVSLDIWFITSLHFKVEPA